MGNTLPSGMSHGSQKPMLLKEEIGELKLVPHLVYATLAEHVYNEPDRRPLPTGWRVLMSCDEVDLNREGYFATAYINERLGHCIIAEKGTSDALGVRAGIWMYFDEPTIQFALAEQFSKLVRLRLSLLRSVSPPTSPRNSSSGGSSSKGPGTSFSAGAGSGGNFTISYTGHSLGAVLAACRACAEHTFAVTFESPGCRLFVEKTMHPFRADDVDIITYLRPPNPINTLKPQCGYLVQLAYSGNQPPDQRGANAKKPAPKSTFAQSLPNPQEYLRSKMLEKTIPEVSQWLNKVEPVIKELVEHTHQVHSISNIVTEFEIAEEENRRGNKGNAEPTAQEVILQWPNHLMQFFEFYNITKAMDDQANQNSHAFRAYEALSEKLYRTAKRPVHKLPLRFLRTDSQTLLRLWQVLPLASLAEIPLSKLEVKTLNTLSIEEDNMASPILTSFQAKQFLSVVTQRPEVHASIDLLAPLEVANRNKPKSKL